VSQRLVHRGEYPPDWDDIGDRVRAENGNRCIRCGHPQGDKMVTRAPCDERCSHARDSRLRILTVHHMDGDKANCRWWNLLALCQICHLQIQAKVIPERAYLWEHADWFKPYVAGFYASFYGGIQITREQAVAELDRWLALGQPWRYEEVTA
jgi:hypothetical protein